MYGISDPQDRELFAFHSLQIDSNFHSHKKLQAVWDMTKSGEYYGGALEEITGAAVDELNRYLLDK
jgi:hypothetical protein